MQNDAKRTEYHKFQNLEIPPDVKLVGGMKPLKLLIPFAKFPYNALKRGFELTPAGLTELLDPKVAGNPAIKHRIIANAAMGTAAMAPMIYYALSGKITGAAPQTGRDKALFYASGKKPYSIQIGDKWVPYKFAPGPFVPLLAAAAGVADRYKHRDDSPDQNLVAQIGLTIAKAGFDFSSLSGLRSLDNAINNPTSGSTKWLADFTSGFIPYGGAARKLTGIIDPYVRDPQTVYERIVSGLPLISETVPAKVDQFGEKVKRTPTGLNALNPFGSSPKSKDKVILELERIGVAPSEVGWRTTIDDKKTKLTPGQHRRAQVMIGRAAYKAVKDFINQPYYNSLSDEEKTREVQREIDRAKDLAREDFKMTLTNNGR